MDSDFQAKEKQKVKERSQTVVSNKDFSVIYI